MMTLYQCHGSCGKSSITGRDPVNTQIHRMIWVLFLSSKQRQSTNSPKMRLNSTPFLSVLALVAPISLSVAATPSSNHPQTIYAWPLTAPSPTALATLTYDPISLTASLKSYTPPKVPSADARSASSWFSTSSSQSASDGDATASLIRIGLYDPSTKRWTGTVTAVENFAVEDGARPKLTLVVDGKGRVFSVAFGTESVGDEEEVNGQADDKQKKQEPQRKKGAKDEKDGEEIRIELVRRTAGPKPVLNKPAVVDADGRVEGQVPEKSFVQK